VGECMGESLRGSFELGQVELRAEKSEFG